MINEKQSFFEKLTGAAPYNDTPAENKQLPEGGDAPLEKPEETPSADGENVSEEKTTEEGQLTVDVYQTPTHIVVQAPMAGVKPEDVDVSINNDMITIRGKRHQKNEMGGDDYYYRELFWGPFSRSVLMPDEVDSNRTEASFKNGLLTVKMPKVNKDGVHQVKIQTKEV
ncbi:MAG: hypothetical protein A3H64_01910 [Candidatus Ryanbacteria bacterium RIFCSPLOWO2_02_FULL_45_11c]|uniref:SHSP domain-containing protein n=1 Tax=Candidatus Ryanbacteria bacterium RIFCSPLOWO2_02_FULL_45_11c TaxID=1802128 RepID=A0A1G2GZH1_9BACT|nr:MAG: hypothetical protein A3H64_01910 [Candidatus Ryanbacteria bacterium RIFCSPLOWO2_02_FULL_45_11c]